MTLERRTIVSVQGRFHAFDLARELDLRGRLARLFTSYPSGIVPRFGVDEDLVASLPWIEVSSRALRRVAPRRAKRMAPWFGARYDRWVASELREGPDSFVGWSGQCLESLRRARSMGMTTFVERGSAHIETQRDLLLEASAQGGVPAHLPEPETIDRELAEYEVCDFVQVPSEFARRTFVERGVPAEKVLVNPYGVELGAFTPAAEEPPGLRLLFCGRASVQKGLAQLLEAFAGLRRPDAELWIQGSVEPDARELRERCVDARVKWLDHVPQHELPQVYRACHALVLPSFQDGFGLVVPQAMASGLPVVVSDNTGAADLVHDGVEGFVVATGDVDALGAALSTLADDEVRRREMGVAARRRVSTGFGWDDYGRRAVEMIDAGVRFHTDRRVLTPLPGGHQWRRAG